MKFSNGISLYNKQYSKAHKIRKNDILEKNINFSVPLIDNELSTKKTNNIYKKENSKDKATLIKSFYNKNNKNSKSKSKSYSNSKEYGRRKKSNNRNNNININIRNQNAYFNNNTSYNKNKYIFSYYIMTPLYCLKTYEKVLSKIFEYIKSVLPKKLFIEIKKMYIKYVLEELNIKNDINKIISSKSESEIMNINLKLFYNKVSSVNRSSSKSSKNKSKNKKNEYSFTRNYSNKGMKINTKKSKTIKNDFSKQYIFNGILNNHHSLYSINKDFSKIPGAPFTFNVTKSPNKSKSKSGSKDNRTRNKNTNKIYKSNNNIFDPDLHVYKILNQRKKNSSFHKKTSQNTYNISNNNKAKKQITNNLIFNKKKKANNLNLITKKKAVTSNNLLVSENKKINKNERRNKIRENEKNNVDDKENKNEEQLKQIKSGLDENLKFLFNFSYENFLNRESENDSKKSVSDYNNV